MTQWIDLNLPFGPIYNYARFDHLKDVERPEMWVLDANGEEVLDAEGNPIETEEGKAYNKLWEEAEKSGPDELDSMRLRGLVRPGVQVEVRDESTGGTRRLLIGDVNPLGGACDDCRDLRSDDVVLRYRVLVTEEDLAA